MNWLRILTEGAGFIKVGFNRIIPAMRASVIAVFIHYDS